MFPLKKIDSKKWFVCIGIFIICSAALSSNSAYAIGDSRLLKISVANTFSDSGLMAAMANDFGILYPDVKIKIQSVGSLQALGHVKNKQADIVITHYPQEEKRLLKQGYILSRAQIAHSKFAVFGPVDDELELSNSKSFIEVFNKMAEDEVNFVVPSPRGATYAKTEELWALAGINPDWPGYEHSSISSTAALRQADVFESYAVADLGVYYNIKEQLSGRIKPLYFNDLALQNTYSVMVITEYDNAKLFYDYLISEVGQNRLYQNARHIFNANIVVPAAAHDAELLYLRKSQKLLDEKTSLKTSVIILSLLLTLLVIIIAYYVTIQRSKTRNQQNKHKIELLNIAKFNAEKANEIKSNFIANITHDLRSPMHAILGYAELCKQKVSLGEYKKTDTYISNIQCAGNRLLLLINDLLEISKLEKEGGVEFKFDNVVLHELVSQSVAEMDCLLQEKNIAIDIKPTNSKKVVSADSERIARVINNLLSNAVKFSPKSSEIIITIDDVILSHPAANDVAATVVHITDHGVGIPENETKLIFNKFVQSSRNLSRIDGTGLGLSICTEIIKAHNGLIEATNNNGLGATFKFTIPDVQPG